ncbi:MAG: type II toxin-antitoxin system RelE/ParE family toxin, partial [Xanthobacteraceae bacterium]
MPHPRRSTRALCTTTRTRVIIREVVYHDLDRIYAWIAKDRPRSADTVLERILESVERLGQLPYMGHIGRGPGNVRMGDT